MRGNSGCLSIQGLPLHSAIIMGAPRAIDDDELDEADEDEIIDDDGEEDSDEDEQDEDDGQEEWKVGSAGFARP